MIPKKIHYVWFGEKEKTTEVKRCIETWKKYLSDYEIIEWNESNFDSEKFPFVAEALESKMYAFASDFVRLWAVYNFGGIYLDTDVEVIKSYDELLGNKAFFGTEEVDSINSGLSFGAEKNNDVIKELMDLYIGRNFIEADGSFNLKTTNMIVTEYFVKNGFKLKSEIQNIRGVLIYPRPYFSPIKWWNGKKKIESVTYSIHWYDSSWLSENEQSKYLKGANVVMKHYIILSIRKCFGYFSYERVKKIVLHKRS
ncbi:MAG: glycosyltransferase family 32 protein [Leuconostoc lactis]|uniref:glycosyltransferase family 32 protein n=1 Tax=Leuconostoc lactis TaxID=1246 RepID=UPI00241C791C|nr:glycosyltransferase [Leuconostoc lactis]